MSTVTRLLFIGDLHHQAQDRGYLMCQSVLPLLRNLTGGIKVPPQCYIQLGDLIDGYELPLQTNRNDLNTVMAQLRASRIPVHAIIGNHETYWLPDPPFHLQALGLQSLSRVIELDWRIVLLDVTVANESYGELTPERARWLRAAATAQPLRPVVIVQHQLIHPSDEVCTNRLYVRNSGEYRRLLAELPNVKLLITGHRHIPTLIQLNEAARPIPQITLGAFCSFPFTVGELTFDSTTRDAFFRERTLESLCELDPALGFNALLERSQRGIIADNPEVWTARPRLTAELRELHITGAV